MQKKKQGISLIVLVITIIVMIILVAAIIISLQNNGIIDRASTAVKSYNEDEVSHMASLAWSEAYLNPEVTTDAQYEAAVTGALQNSGVDLSKYLITVTKSGVTVKDKSKVWIQDGLNITKGNVTLEAGDLIQYNAGVQGYTGKWKVLGAEDGNLLIVSTTSVGSLGLFGLEGGSPEWDNTLTYDYGLLNGISRLNELCEPYGEGSGAVGARSIKVEDLDKLTGYDKTTYGANQLKQYGNEVTYSWNEVTSGAVDYTSTNNTGTLSITHSNGFRYVDFNTMTETTVLVDHTGLPTLTSNYYGYDVSDTTLPTRSTKATEMLFGLEANGYDEYYWLASPFVTTNTSYINFGLRDVASGHVDSVSLFSSRGDENNSEEDRVRAVVKLSPNITIGEKDNTLGWSYTI